MPNLKSAWSRVKRRTRKVTNNEPMTLGIKPSHLLIGSGVGLVAAYVFYDMGRTGGYRDGSRDLALAPTGRAMDPSMFVSEERRWVDAYEDRQRTEESEAVLLESIQGGRPR